MIIFYASQLMHCSKINLWIKIEGETINDSIKGYPVGYG